MTTINHNRDGGWWLTIKQLPLSVLIGGAGCAISAVMFLLLAPLQGHFLIDTLGTLALTLLPGYLILAALRLPASRSPWGLVVLSFVVGLGLFEGVSLAVVEMGFAAGNAGWIMAVIELALMAILIVQSRRGLAPTFDFSARPKSEWWADGVALVVALALAGVNMTIVQSAMSTANQDWSTYMEHATWMLVHPGEPLETHSEYPIEKNYRLTTSGWIAVNAALADIFRADAAILDVHWRDLPPLLIIMAVGAVQALACELFENPAARVAAILVHALQVSVTVSLADYFQIGYATLFRMSHDKILLAYLIVPAGSLATVLCVKQGRLSYLAAFFLVAGCAALTHPLGLPSLLVVAGSYAAVAWLAKPSRKAFWRMALVVAVSAPWLALAILQQINQPPEDDYYILYTLQGITEASATNVAPFYELTVISYDNNLFTAPLYYLTLPIAAIGILVGLGMALRLRESNTARYLFAATVAPLAVSYIPGVTALVSRIVTAGLIHRFFWLLPSSLAVGWALFAGLNWLGKVPGAFPRVGRFALAGAALMVAIGLGFQRNWADLLAALSIAQSLRDNHRDSVAVAIYVRDHIPPGDTILAPTFDEYNGMIMGLAPEIKVAYYLRPIDIARDNLVRAMYSSPILRPEAAELLISRSVDYIVVPRHVEMEKWLDPNYFELTQAFDRANLYHVKDVSRLAYAYFDPDTVSHDYQRLIDTLIKRGSATALLDTPGDWPQTQSKVVAHLRSHYPDGPTIIPLPDDVTTQALASLMAGQQRVHLVTWGEGWQDRSRRVERAIVERGFLDNVEWIGKLRLLTISPLDQVDASPTPSEARFGKAIRLASWLVTTTEASPGDWIGVSLRWTAQAKPDSRYNIGVYLMDTALSRVDAQHDGEPVMGLSPTSEWQIGQSITDNHVVVLPPGLTPGERLLAVAIYDSEGRRLPLLNQPARADLLVLGSVVIR